MEIGNIIYDLFKLDSQIDISLYFDTNEDKDLLLYNTINLIKKQYFMIDLMAKELTGIYRNKFGSSKEEVIKRFEKNIEDYDR